MNSLLPLNEQQELHLLDDYFGSRIDKLNRLNLNVHPLFAEEKYLQLLSFILEIDIAGLSEQEARELLSLFVELKKYAGTVYVLKKVMSIFFNDVTLDDQIGDYLFDLNVEMKNDVSIEKLKRIRELAHKYKNVRSKLRDIIINLPLLQTEIKLTSACVFGLDIDSKSLIKQDFDTKIHLKSACSFRLNFKTVAKLEDLSTQVHLENACNFRVGFNTSTKLDIEDFKTQIYKQGGLLWRL